jgi:transcription elongation factor GreA-like protein
MDYGKKIVYSFRNTSINYVISNVQNWGANNIMQLNNWNMHVFAREGTFVQHNSE